MIFFLLIVQTENVFVRSFKMVIYVLFCSIEIWHIFNKRLSCVFTTTSCHPFCEIEYLKK